MCQEQAICWIHASRQFFGKTECPGTADAEMYLWLVYSCDGGGTDKTTTHTPTCDSSSTPPTPTTSSPTPTTTPTPPTETCSHDDRGLPWGEKVQLDVPGCDGSIDIVCDKGCIAVHKVTPAHPNVLYHRIVQVLYSCRKKPTSDSAQLKLVKELCNDRQRCKIFANRETFGNEECPDAGDAKMKLWLVYSCDGGGSDLTIIRKPIC